MGARAAVDVLLLPKRFLRYPASSLVAVPTTVTFLYSKISCFRYVISSDSVILTISGDVKVFTESKTS